MTVPWQIEYALKMLPTQCRFHGDDLDSKNIYRAPEAACCDTGRYARARREALAALELVAAGLSGTDTPTEDGE